MKAYTLSPLIALLIALGEKRIDTHGFATNHRGPVAIHAGKSFPRHQRELLQREPYRSVLKRHNVKSIRMGAVVCVANLSAVERTESLLPRLSSFARHEARFGDFGPKRFGFIYDVVLTLQRPIPIGGWPGFWELPRHVSDRLSERLAELNNHPSA